MDMERLGHRYHQAKRATVARSALDVIAMVFLGCAFCFWGVAFWQLLAPPALLSLLSIQAVVLALVYALATPLLWSALVPSTPAGQLLQKTQWKTFGFAAIVASAAYLSYQAELLIETWLYAQPAIGESGLARSLAFSLSIGFILIPALAWTQLTPERWLQQIQQAHQVKKLEAMQKGELAIIKSRLLWAEQRAAMSFANLLPTEQQEILDTLNGLFRGINDTQRSIGRSLGLSADLERSLMDDAEIADQLDYVKDQLQLREVGVIPAVPAVSPQRPAEDYTPRVIARQDAAPDRDAAGRGGAGRGSLPQSAAVGGSQPQYAAEYGAARGKLSGTWSAARLGEAIGKSPRSALERIYAWQRAGLVGVEKDAKGAYYFTEREAA